MNEKIFEEYNIPGLDITETNSYVAIVQSNYTANTNKNTNKTTNTTTGGVEDGFATVITILVLIPAMMIATVPFWFPVLLVVLIARALKRSSVRKQFKSNVISESNWISQENKHINNSATGDNRLVYSDVSKVKLDTLNIADIDVLKDYLYRMFYKFEKAYNNLDYDKMRRLSTKKLYESYHTGIVLDLQVGRKRIMEDMQKKDVKVFNVLNSDTEQKIYSAIEVDYINYVIDSDGNVISGNKYFATNERFEVVFTKTFGADEIARCPHCGAPVEGNECTYCRTPIKSDVFKISSIKRIVTNLPTDK